MTHAKEQTDRTVFGFWLYILSDCILFATLFAVYAVLRGATFGAATPADLLDLPFVLIQTLLLLTSSFTVGIALWAAHERKRAWVLSALSATFLLGLSFLALEFIEFRHLLLEGEGPARSASLSAFFALVGTHGLHVAGGLLWLLVVAAHILLKGFAAPTTQKLWCFALFWHFLDIVWIFIFSFVYLFGALI